MKIMFFLTFVFSTIFFNTNCFDSKLENNIQRYYLGLTLTLTKEKADDAKIEHYLRLLVENGEDVINHFYDCLNISISKKEIKLASRCYYVLLGLGETPLINKKALGDDADLFCQKVSQEIACFQNAPCARTKEEKKKLERKKKMQNLKQNNKNARNEIENDLKRGMSVNQLLRGMSVNQLLNLAVTRGNNHKIKILIQKYGADINSKLNGRTPLRNGICTNQVEAVKLLISSGAEVNINSDLGNTLLHFAVTNFQDEKDPNLEIIKLLLSKLSKENIYAKTAKGRNALHLAAMHNKLKVFKLLLNEGFKLDEKSDQNETVLDLAQMFNCQEILDYLKEIK